MRPTGSQGLERTNLSGNTDDNINILKKRKAVLKTDSCLWSLQKWWRICWQIYLAEVGEAQVLFHHLY